MDILSSFIDFMSQLNLSAKKDKLLLAVSGGVDSMVLCELVSRAGYDFVISHCNFQLRSDESERDQQFVESLENKYGKKVLVKKFNTDSYAEKNKLSIQTAARELRYQWFDELLKTEADWLLTAHHADDNLETVLMNFFKGTGIAGLRGIVPKQNRIIRPLLLFRKKELLDFAQANGLSWVEDSSNASDKYSRNYFRQQIIPLVQKIFPQAEENVLNNIERFRDTEQLYHQSIQLHKKKLIEQKGSEWHIPVLKLKKAEPLNSIIYEIVKEFGFKPGQTSDIKALLDSETGRYVQSSTHRIIRNRKWLIIVSLAAEEPSNIIIERDITSIQLPALQLSFTNNVNKSIKPDASASIAMLDAKHIKYPLILRKSKVGDYFYPLGMKKKKKLARFFIDQKLSKTAKENVWVIESDKRIVWVVGHRIDDRFKIGDATTDILSIKSSL